MFETVPPKRFIAWTIASWSEWKRLLFTEQDAIKLYAKLLSCIRWSGCAIFDYHKPSGRFTVVAGNQLRRFQLFNLIVNIRFLVLAAGCFTDDRIWAQLYDKGIINANHLMIAIHTVWVSSGNVIYIWIWRNSAAAEFGINGCRFYEDRFVEHLGGGSSEMGLRSNFTNRLNKLWAIASLTTPLIFITVLHFYTDGRVWSIKLSENLFRGNINPAGYFLCFVVDAWTIVFGITGFTWFFVLIMYNATSGMDLFGRWRLRSEGHLEGNLRLYDMCLVGLQVLDSVIRSGVAPVTFILCMATTVGNYMLLNVTYLLTFGYGETVAAFCAGFSILVAESAIFKAISAMSANSEELLQTWKNEAQIETINNRRRGEYFAKRLHAMKSLYLHCGDYYRMDKTFYVTYKTMILDQTINLMLTYKCT